MSGDVYVRLSSLQLESLARLPLESLAPPTPELLARLNEAKCAWHFVLNNLVNRVVPKFKAGVTPRAHREWLSAHVGLACASATKNNAAVSRPSPFVALPPCCALRSARLRLW